MKRQWFTPDEVAAKQLACPLSVGQAEAGRYTYCIGDKCMAWTWNPDLIEEAEDDVQEGVNIKEIPEGWSACCKPYSGNDGTDDMYVDIIKNPTHGRCGMVP